VGRGGEPDAYKIPGYHSADMTVAYKVAATGWRRRSYNMFDSQKATRPRGKPPYDQYYCPARAELPAVRQGQLLMIHRRSRPDTRTVAVAFLGLAPRAHAAEAAARPAGPEPSDALRHRPGPSPAPAPGDALAAPPRRKLVEVHRLLITRTPEQLAQATWETSTRRSIFGAALGPGFDLARLPATAGRSGIVTNEFERAGRGQGPFRPQAALGYDASIVVLRRAARARAPDLLSQRHALTGYSLGLVLAG